MAKTLNQDTLDQLAEVLEIEETSATSILQSLISRLLSKAMAFELAYFEAGEYSELASEALYGAADNVDQLEEENGVLTDQRDEARGIAGKLLRLLTLADDAVWDPTPVSPDCFDSLAGKRREYAAELELDTALLQLIRL